MERLQKVIAHAGIASRRKSEELIASGRVQVNGETVVELGTKVSVHDIIVVDGVPLSNEAPVYILMYKPKNVISTVSDDKSRDTVVDLLDEEIKERVYPVGRLDYDTTGALLLTNDGELANRLTHPKYEVEKTYVAKVSGIPTNDELKQIRMGVKVDNDFTASPAKVKVLSVDKPKQRAIVSLTIHEGKNHQVKKMLQAINHPVEKLKRETYAFLQLEGLQPGEWRRLKPEEVKRLKKEVAL
ncbi:16S rRNA uridine-516 pseudouridylate synthase related enzyme [Secundilactobacillus oryzae JCM 18671]|uniref:Pseudouridine synthase n=1 Tax=Secundilactobacillus oryzae JCM 18671 TaxID=1291743 RepID=A0A081BHA4_9LACO|nr:pseudouridine synthase [Secundilactobacillus oryzae]GAK47422.1 16S rRNA uridine-516 pseudouridylate synthase related enzyme [Secundilactobacillus oryzae JCM 18671]